MKVFGKEEFIEKYLNHFNQNFIPASVEKKVSRILDTVRREGDKALIKYAAQFDHAVLKADQIKVQTAEFLCAEKIVSSDVNKTIKNICGNVRRYQKDLLYRDWIKSYGSVRLGSLVRPLNRVGVYVPGGTAPLVSTVIMTVIPAKVAGVKEVIVLTPPDREGNINPFILIACKIAGVDNVYKAGGAQAIAAMAYGTETIPKVEKIAGPGNVYVACAKRQVFGYTGIDMVAGPSEVLIIADKSANPRLVAADLLAQAEHDRLARTFLVTPSIQLIQEVKAEVNKQMESLSRNLIAKESILNHGFMIQVENLNEAVELSNMIAPEHLEILCKNPMNLVRKIRCAGAIFIGENTPEPVGDYVAGPSHVLPTGGTARFFSPLSSREFLKSISFIQYNQKSLKRDLMAIKTLADIEGLDAHRKSAEARFL